MNWLTNSCTHTYTYSFVANTIRMGQTLLFHRGNLHTFYYFSYCFFFSPVQSPPWDASWKACQNNFHFRAYFQQLWCHFWSFKRFVFSLLWLRSIESTVTSSFMCLIRRTSYWFRIEVVTRLGYAYLDLIFHSGLAVHTIFVSEVNIHLIVYTFDSFLTLLFRFERINCDFGFIFYL